MTKYNRSMRPITKFSEIESLDDLLQESAANNPKNDEDSDDKKSKSSDEVEATSVNGVGGFRSQPEAESEDSDKSAVAGSQKKYGFDRRRSPAGAAGRNRPGVVNYRTKWRPPFTKTDIVGKAVLGTLSPGGLADRVADASDKWKTGNMSTGVQDIKAAFRDHFRLYDRPYKDISDNGSENEDGISDAEKMGVYASLKTIVLSDTDTIDKISKFFSKHAPGRTAAKLTTEDTEPEKEESKETVASARMHNAFDPFEISSLRQWGTRIVAVCEVKTRPYFTERGIGALLFTFPSSKDIHYAPCIFYARDLYTGDQIHKLSNIKLPFTINGKVALVGSDSIDAVVDKTSTLEGSFQLPVVQKTESDILLYASEYSEDLKVGDIVLRDADEEPVMIKGVSNASADKLVCGLYSGMFYPQHNLVINSIAYYSDLLDKLNLITVEDTVDEANPADTDTKTANDEDFEQTLTTDSFLDKLIKDQTLLTEAEMEAETPKNPPLADIINFPTSLFVTNVNVQVDEPSRGTANIQISRTFDQETDGKMSGFRITFNGKKGTIVAVDYRGNDIPGTTMPVNIIDNGGYIRLDIDYPEGYTISAHPIKLNTFRVKRNNLISGDIGEQIRLDLKPQDGKLVPSMGSSFEIIGHGDNNTSIIQYIPYHRSQSYKKASEYMKIGSRNINSKKYGFKSRSNTKRPRVAKPRK